MQPNNVDSSTIALNDMGKPPYTSAAEMQESIESEVCVGDEECDLDASMKVVSSELGVKDFFNDLNTDPIVKAQSVLYESTFDTLEDIYTHMQRMPYEKGWTKMPDDSDGSRKTVVVLGSGWAAHALMKVADVARIKLIVVSPTNHFAFTPMLASAAVGRVEFRSMSEATRVANPMMENFIEGEATSVDTKNKKVKVNLNSLLTDVKDVKGSPTIDIDYDYLVVSVGTRVKVANVPGAREHCLKLKTCEDARNLRRDVGEALEYASRPGVSEEEKRRRLTFVVVGGGPTGVELAGELGDFAKQVTERGAAYPKLKDYIRIVLVHGGPDVLPQFEPKLREEALKSLKKSGCEVLLNTRTTEVGDEAVTLSSKIFDSKGEPTGEREDSTLPMGLTVWCAGNEPQPFVNELLKELPEEAKGAQGRVNVDKWFRPKMSSPELTGSVMVIGDAACFEDAKKGSYLPQTAQVAGQQGAYAARMLMRGYDMTATPPKLDETQVDQATINWMKFRNVEDAPGFSFLNLGILAYVGGGEALSQVEFGDFPLFNYGKTRTSLYVLAHLISYSHCIFFSRKYRVSSVEVRIPRKASRNSQSCASHVRLDQDGCVRERCYQTLNYVNK